MFQKIIYESIEVFEKQRMMSPNTLVVGKDLKKRLAKEVHPTAVDVQVICGLVVQEDEEMEGMSFVMF